MQKENLTWDQIFYDFINTVTRDKPLFRLIIVKKNLNACFDYQATILSSIIPNVVHFIN